MDTRTFGQRLKERRNYLNYTLDTVARKANSMAGRDVVSRSTISHLEHDRHEPSMAVLKALTEVLETSLDWLIKGEDGSGDRVDHIKYWASKIPESKQVLLENVARDFFESTKQDTAPKD